MLLGENVHERESAPLNERVGDRLAAISLKLGLVVEQLKLAGAAGHEQIDDALGPRYHVARPGLEGIRTAGPHVARPKGSTRVAIRLRHRGGLLLASRK